MNRKEYSKQAVNLLARMIAIPSFSKEEDEVADLIEDWLKTHGFESQRIGNNNIAFAKPLDKEAPTILLNSHIDTVKAGEQWTLDPFLPVVKDGKLHGLGSNDAGASVVSLLYSFLYLSQIETIPYNLIIAITAEEEISGRNGIEMILPSLPKVDLAIVGEPTEMKVAIAERGLMVLDVETKGETGHAARDEGENAIYKSLDDVQWFQEYQFPNSSEFLGPVKMTVTQIEAGKQHNVIPDLCKYVVDVRINELYTHQEILDKINQSISGHAQPRSMRLKASGIDKNHAFVKHIDASKIPTFGSATMSDQALIPFPSVKMGPGESERSHRPDEYIFLEEIEQAIEIYTSLLESFRF